MILKPSHDHNTLGLDVKSHPVHRMYNVLSCDQIKVLYIE